MYVNIIFYTMVSRSRDRKKRLLSMAHNPHVEKEGGKVWKRDKENDHYKKVSCLMSSLQLIFEIILCNPPPPAIGGAPFLNL